MRTWTAADGRRIEAMLIEGGEESFRIRLADGRTFDLKPSQVSAEDQTYVTQTLKDRALEAQREAGLASGPYAEACVGEWQKMTAEDGLRFHFFANKRDLKEGQTYPLCIYLHGSSNTGSDLEKREPGANAFANEAFYEARPCFVIAPEAPAGTGAFKQIAPRILALIDHLTLHLPIDRERIYLTGYSMGSRGCWDLLIAAPERFAAAVPIAGPLGGNAVKDLPKVAIWMHYGELDKKDEFLALSAALKAAGHDFRETEHPGADHVSFHGKVAKDPAVHEWMFAQKRSSR
ncbi:MAG: dienelactone hydrolase family protein [Verrucomicrobiales bacterium]|nr:dienelactone hydrolase family protein [Verrucomicrobiales bacterium]